MFHPCVLEVLENLAHVVNPVVAWEPGIPWANLWAHLGPISLMVKGSSATFLPPGKPIARRSTPKTSQQLATDFNMSVSVLASSVNVLSETSPRLADTRRLQEKVDPAGWLLQQLSLALLV